MISEMSMDTRKPGSSRNIEQTSLCSADICGVVVVYNPGKTLAENVERLSSQVSRVVLIDNGSKTEYHSRIEATASQRVEVLGNARNLGIAAALNQGLRRADELGYPWAITLDQDSRPTPDMIERLCDAFGCIGEPDRLVILAPQIFNLGLDKPTYYLKPRFGPFYHRARCQEGILESVSTVITSGSLINVDIFQKMGGYREDFFMDYVDTEFCLRARREGYNIVVACEARLDHVLGNRKEVRVGRLRMYPTYHSPQRWYTISRNRITMIRMYALRFPHWFAYEIVASWYTLARMLLLERDRAKKIRAIWRGFLDGLRGKMGEGA